MRKKGFLIFVCMAGLMIVLPGCEKTQEIKEQNEETQTKSVAENIEEVFAHAPEGKEIITDYKKFKAPQEDQSYHFDTDYQYYVSSTWGSVKIEDCYYIYDNGLIKVLDENTHAEHLLCTKPDCPHTDYQSCSALIPNDSGIAYYKGNLYSIGNSQCLENGEEGIIKYSLIKTSSSGSTKDKEKDILKVAMADMNISGNGYTMGVNYMQHRGYMYYTYVAGNVVSDKEFYMNGSNCLYRVPLEGEGEPECILPLEKGTNSWVMSTTAEGSYIYFVMTDSQMFGELYRYNTESDVVEKMNIGRIAAECYTVINGKILYKKTFDAKQLYLYDPMTDTEELLADMTDMAEGDSWNIRHDSNRIYVYYTNAQQKEAFYIVLNLEGDYVQKILLSDKFEEEEHLMVDFFASNESSVVCHIFGAEEYLYFEKQE